MQRKKQITIIKELMRQLDEKVNIDAGVQYRNPAKAYADRELAELEWERFFKEHPQVIGLSGALPEPGAYITVDDFGVPVLATRDKQGEFRAFVNSCRHRGVRLAEEGRGKRFKFMCPFHHWTYANSGELINIPRAHDFGDFDKSCHGLVELPAIEHHGLLMVHPQPDGHLDPVALLGELGDEIAGWNFDSLVYVGESLLENKLNWKLANDTFGETYHFGRLHKDTLGRLFQGDALHYEEFGRNHRFVWANHGIDQLKSLPEDDWHYEAATGWIYYLFPNIQLTGGGHTSSLIKIYPDATNPGRCRTRVSHYFSQEIIDEASKSDNVSSPDNVYDFDNGKRKLPSLEATMEIFTSTIEQEDYLMGETTQRSAESGVIKEFIFGRNEPALHHYHNTYREALNLPPLEKVT